MKVLVTGSSGQLGMDLVPLLASFGHETAAFTREEFDITSRLSVFKALEEASPACVVNCAAYTKVDLAEKESERAYAVNRDGAANLADGAHAIGAALIHVSTDFVFDGRKPVPYEEGDHAAPLGVYGSSKLAGEMEVAKRCPRSFIIRTSWLYGVNGANFVKTILKYACERNTLRVVYDQTGTPTWSADLAGAIAAVISSNGAWEGRFGTYHYSSEGVTSWYDFAHAILEEARRNGAPVKCTNLEAILTREYPTPARRPAYSVLDKAKIKKAFGLKPPHWRESLSMMFERLGEG